MRDEWKFYGDDDLASTIVGENLSWGREADEPADESSTNPADRLFRPRDGVLKLNTVHRLAPWGSRMHRQAQTPTRTRRVIAALPTDWVDRSFAGQDGDSLDGLLFDALLDGPVYVTLVADLRNDASTVEIVHGVAVGIEEIEDPETGTQVEYVTFQDGDRLRLFDIATMRADLG